ncbi:hypothetical protein ZIOFF_057657 [Zingiber officinale]|uniref:Protein groES n=1 Tax=Zingiber officinale TaxID=94328 RepID=A0A8J5KAD4_ZINOF|nr:hypothetical protein ZIOFF_057657 [Zingiber officinale]
MAKRLIPSLNRILVEKIVPPSKTSAGILLPEKTTKLNSGKVVAVGPGLHDSNGNHIPVSVKEGDTVLLPEYGGTEVKLGDKEFFKVSKPNTKLSYVWFGDQPFELVLKQYYSGKYGANVHHACVSGIMFTGMMTYLGPFKTDTVMWKLVMEVDLDCHLCSKKIKRTICKLQEKVKILRISYDQKNGIVTIAGRFDPERVSKKLKDEAGKLNSGKVVAVGLGLHDSNGNRIPVSVKEGDTVLLPEYGGT